MTGNPESILTELESITGTKREYLLERPVVVSERTRESFHSGVIQTVMGLVAFYNERKLRLLPEETQALQSICRLESLPALEMSDIFGRPDGFLTQDGFKVIEMNLGPSIGGLIAIDILQKYWLKKTNDQFDFGRLCDSLAACLSEKVANSNVPIIAYRIHDPRFARYEFQNTVLEEILKRCGLNFRFLFLSELYSVIGAGTNPSLLLRRHEPETGDPHDVALREFERYAADRKLDMLCPREIFDVLDSKLFLAFFSEYCKPTGVVLSRWVGSSELIKIDKFKDRFTFLKENRKQYVLKRDASFFGMHVIFGDEVDSQSEWEMILNNALADGNWIFQEIQTGVALETEMDVAGSKGPLYGVMSPYIFGSKFGGIAVRVRLDEAHKNCVMPHNSKTLISIAGFRREANPSC